MFIKRILCTAIVLASYFLFTSFTPDSCGRLTLNSNASLQEYDRDIAWRDASTAVPGCHQKACIPGDFDIAQNGAEFRKCCCENSLLCSNWQ
jgi:hypothetical protein